MDSKMTPLTVQERLILSNIPDDKETTMMVLSPLAFPDYNHP